MWKTDLDVVVHCLQHPNKIVFLRTSILLRNSWQLEHSSDSYTCQCFVLHNCWLIISFQHYLHVELLSGKVYTYATKTVHLTCNSMGLCVWKLNVIAKDHDKEDKCVWIGLSTNCQRAQLSSLPFNKCITMNSNDAMVTTAYDSTDSTATSVYNEASLLSTVSLHLTAVGVTTRVAVSAADV